jgi:hypothetical protein
MDIFFGGFLSDSEINILSTVTTCSTCGSVLYAVDKAFSTFAVLSPLVTILHYSCFDFSKINHMT